MLPNPFAQHGPIKVEVKPEFYPIRGDNDPRIPLAMPEERTVALFALQGGAAVQLERNDTSDPWYLYQVSILFAQHDASGAGPPDGPYGIYIVNGGRIVARLIDSQVHLSTDSVTGLEITRSCPFVQMPWAINRQESLVFVYNLQSTGDASESPAAGSPTAINGLTIRYILRR